MTDKEINGLISNLLLGRSISQIDKSQSFIIQLNHYPSRNDSFPSLLFIELLSDWHIKEVGNWSEINNFFPLSTSNIAIPYDPIKAFYLHYLSENSVITNVCFDESSFLEIEFNNKFTLMLPNTNDFDEISWSITGKNLNISYNNEDEKCYIETAF